MQLRPDTLTGIDGGGDVRFQVFPEAGAEAVDEGAEGGFLQAGFGGEAGERPVGRVAVEEGAES